MWPWITSICFLLRGCDALRYWQETNMEMLAPGVSII
jgi:hypothetical protein